MKKRAGVLAVILGLAVMALMTASCGGGGGGSSWQLVGEKTWEDKAKMSLFVNDDALATGEVLRVRVVVENISDEQIEYTMWNIGDPPVYTMIKNPYGDDIALRAPEDPTVVQPAVTFGALEPGKVIEREVFWDLTIGTSSGNMPAPNGIYTLEAAFYLGRQVDGPGEQLLLSHEIVVSGSTDLILPEDALQKASAQTSMKLWLEAHIGPAVAREQKGEYFVNMGGEWQPASQQAYQEALASLSTSVLLEPGQWEVTLASKFGFPPDEIVVKIDGETGNVASIVPDLEAELKGGVLAAFDVQGSKFRVFVTDPDTIAGLFRLQQGASQATIPIGALRSGPGAGLHNAPWSWHLEDARLAEFTIELCDGNPQYVEEELDYWLNTVQSYCPWSAILVGIEDHR